jgi:hypothetical protein
MNIKRFAAASGTAVLLAFSLTACGGDAPTDASTDDFCEAFNAQSAVFTELDPEASPADQAEALTDGLKEYAEKLEEVGTPEGISDEAREGFEITVDELGDLDEGDVEKAIEDGDSNFAGISDEDEEKANAFNEYASEECGSPAE